MLKRAHQGTKRLLHLGGRALDWREKRWSRLWRMAQLASINVSSRREVCEPGGPVVSLTSYGSRVRTVALTIESIARGTMRPSRLILWLDEQQWLDAPPRAIRRLQERGLEVAWTHNYGPHKKYYPLVASEPDPQQPLVTADDDVLYPTHWLESLVRCSEAHQGEVICHRAQQLAWKGGELLPYHLWPDCRSTAASHCHFTVGVSGVLYPPAVQRALRQSGEAFRERCPRADDIWLNLHALRTGHPVRQVRERPAHFPLTVGTQAVGLVWENTDRGGNDVQLRATYSADDVAYLAGLAGIAAAMQLSTSGARGRDASRSTTPNLTTERRV